MWVSMPLDFPGGCCSTILWYHSCRNLCCHNRWSLIGPGVVLPDMWGQWWICRINNLELRPHRGIPEGTSRLRQNSNQREAVPGATMSCHCQRSLGVRFVVLKWSYQTLTPFVAGRDSANATQIDKELVSMWLEQDIMEHSESMGISGHLLNRDLAL